MCLEEFQWSECACVQRFDLRGDRGGKGYPPGLRLFPVPSHAERQERELYQLGPPRLRE